MKAKCDTCGNELRQSGGQYGGNLELTYFKCDTCDYTLLVLPMIKGSKYTIHLLTKEQDDRVHFLKKEISQRKLEIQEFQNKLEELE